MNWKDKRKQKLIQAILTLKTSDEIKRFLRDLMTETEIEEFSKRLQAAEMLTENIPYSIIVKETGLSSTTVARVAKWLNSSLGGYKTVIKRLHHHNSIQSRRELS
jgi:TrpR-related protein YerC/YecD